MEVFPDAVFLPAGKEHTLYMSEHTRSSPFFSICIPAYKHADFLRRLLQSIATQTFRDFEVIVTDDSPGNELMEVVTTFEKQFPLVYKKNAQALGTPENWNEAIRHASGKWIKIMHHDDWFATNDALAAFAQTIAANPGTGFIFSAFNNVSLPEHKTETEYAPGARLNQLQQMPMILVARNIVGPPSTTLFKNDQSLWYDKRMKWFVDIDFYMRILQQSNFAYIPKALVNVGLHNEQVTTYTFRRPEVEIPEGMLLLSKHDTAWTKNALAYDGWWRYIRNLNIRSLQDIYLHAPAATIPAAIVHMVRAQQRIPAAVLKKGILSKGFMALNFIVNKNKLKR